MSPTLFRGPYCGSKRLLDATPKLDDQWVPDQFLYIEFAIYCSYVSGIRVCFCGSKRLLEATPELDDKWFVDQFLYIEFVIHCSYVSDIVQWFLLWLWAVVIEATPELDNQWVADKFLRDRVFSLSSVTSRACQSGPFLSALTGTDFPRLLLAVAASRVAAPEVTIRESFRHRIWDTLVVC